MREQAEDKNGFSLLELIVTIAVIALLTAISMPLFLSFIRHASFMAAKKSLKNAHTSCISNKQPETPNNFWDAKFSYSNLTAACTGTMSAAFKEGCEVSINLANGDKTSSGTPGWPGSLDTCNIQEPIASQTNDKLQKENGEQAIINKDKSDYEEGRRIPSYKVSGYIGATQRRLAQCFYNIQLIEVDANYQPSKEQHPFLSLDENGENPPGIMTHRFDNMGLTSCKSVRIPASHFEGGVLPKPFEVKNGRGIFPAKLWNPLSEDSYPEGSIHPQRLFDSEGYPIALVNPKRDTAWMKEKYPDIDLSTISTGICDPRRGPAGLKEDCQKPDS